MFDCKLDTRGARQSAGGCTNSYKRIRLYRSVQVIVIISRANADGMFDDRAANQKVYVDISESTAVWQAIKFAGGRAYSISFYKNNIMETPFRTIMQTSLLGGGNETDARSSM